MTTIADIKRANSNAKRTGWQITSGTMTNSSAVSIWLREIQLLEAAVRSYYTEQRGAGVK